MKLIQSLLVILAIGTLSACSPAQTKKLDVQERPALKALLENSNRPAVIKFHALWCASCRQYAPSFEAVAKVTSGVDFISINIDAQEYKDLVREFKISRIPDTAFVSADRATVYKKLGPLSEKTLTKTIIKIKSK